ncbi:hypothetical protein [Streptomyces longwoodensis]
MRERLAAAHWDLRAALLATGSAASAYTDGVPPRLRSLLRHPPPAWNQADEPPVALAVPAAVRTPDRSGAVSLLTALAAGEHDVVHVLGVAPGGLFARVVRVAADGRLATDSEPGGDTPWERLARWLARSRPERDFLLAGGIGTAPPYGSGAVPVAVEDAWKGVLEGPVQGLLTAVRADREHGRAAPVLLTGPAPGARWPAYALRLLADGAPPAARLELAAGDAYDIDGVLASLVRRVPLRHGYALLTRAADGAGPEALPLFPPGLVVPDAGEIRASVRLTGPPGAASGACVLPLVSARGPRLRDWAVVHTGQTDARPGRQTEVTVVMDSSGRLRFTAPRGVVETLLDEDVLLGRPAPDQDQTPDVDLLILLERGGSMSDLARRTELLLRVLARLEGARPAAGALRVGLLAYGPHVFDPRRKGDREQDTVTREGPTEPAVLARTVQRLLPTPRGHAFAAPLEDALAEAASWPWREEGRRVLLIVGSRPPHPARQERDTALPCPHGLDWQAALDVLRVRLGVLVFSVRDWLPLRGALAAEDPAWRRASRDRVIRSWQELGREHLYDLAEQGLAEISAAVRIATGLPAATPSLMVGAGVESDADRPPRKSQESERS